MIYLGRLISDEEHATVTHTPIIAFIPNLIGNPERLIELGQDRLILAAEHPHLNANRSLNVPTN